ncbi:nucleotidyltransferase [Candidatus Kuenenbacteria bacterium CG11_big_fil_rev_8_21_14_0_20_37_9]|uniref:Nucleotidyltransferase n=1 Tax=Candidatus Kuenenbacteria bacterium CG08_land_8_20_14_0_20_37_23 TaxID=1974617 RepID=A0A2M6XSI9_9BACT|nr:MAG: nucleotidyltransferase [Candidatus Kuenenbacteria bacterium CG11_big_fil_rev_8_21_14_0_20_37_9]PIU10607.1 MAG: nucleotidyltransferase [Candidatus Kuenenbacteria bacterium CG08_land_8_20_14_0_20_37_23]
MTKEEIKNNIRKSIQRSQHLDKIKKVSLFRSYLSDMAREDSDVDLLVEFDRGISLFDLADMQRVIENDVKKKVDLLTPNSLSKYFRDEVINQAELIYER